MDADGIQAETTPTPVPIGKPWGFWPTMGFSCIIGIVSIAFTVALTVVYFIVSKVRDPKLDIMEMAQSLESNSDFFAISIIISFFPIVGLSIFFAWVRKHISIKEYLYFNTPTRKQLIMWSLVTLLYVGLMELVSYGLTFTGRTFISEFTLNIYSTARFKSLLIIAVMIAAPLLEEILCRGFMFRGIASSRIGTIGAAIITSFIWTIMHTQYDIIILTCTFIGGLLFSRALVKTQSIYVPITMHIIWNNFATIEVVIYLAFTS